MRSYRLSLMVPMRFRTIYGQDIAASDVQAGGHGNHFRDDDHHDGVTVSWWQWRGRIWRTRTMAICLP